MLIWKKQEYLNPHTNAKWSGPMFHYRWSDKFHWNRQFLFFSFSDETLLISNTSVHRKCQYCRPRGGSLFFWDKNNVKSHKPNIKGIFCLFFPSNDVVMTGRQWYRRRWTHYLRQKDVSEEWKENITESRWNLIRNSGDLKNFWKE